MLRLTLDHIPFGDWSRTKRIGTLMLTNDGTGNPERGNYNVILELSSAEQAKKGHMPQRTRIYDFARLPHLKGRAWDLAYIALRDLLARRNPWQPHRENEAIYVLDGSKYVPVKEFEGFPTTGVFLVYKDNEEPGRHASFRWIGDIPPADALTYAAAQVHYDRACKALTEMKNTSVQETVEIKRRLDEQELMYRWQEPSISDVVRCVLNAVAEGQVIAAAADTERQP